MSRKPIILDPDLGTLRYCARCDEWWPDDAEFWYISRHRRECLACRWERQRTRYEHPMVNT